MAKATRAAFGPTLLELVDEGIDVMAVDADLAGSTTTAKLAAAHPDRFVDVGIAEQNMIGVASGLALTGRTVFTGSFAVFGSGRCWEQIRNTVCISDLNVKVCPTHAGITVGPDGETHQALEDIALSAFCPICACWFRLTTTPPAPPSSSPQRPPAPSMCAWAASLCPRSTARTSP